MNHPQPMDALMNQHGISNAMLVHASTEQLTFKNVVNGRKGRRLSVKIQDKILKAFLTAKPDLKLSRRDLFRYDMTEEAISQIEEAAILTAAHKINYPQYVDRLIAAGVTRYFVQTATGETTFFGVEGQAYIKPVHFSCEDSPGLYSLEGLQAAIAAAQKNSIDYPVFLKKIRQAGIVSYEANLRSREIKYRGESLSYKERIPAANAESAVALEPVLKRTESIAQKPTPNIKKKPKKKAKVNNSLKARKAAKKSWNKRR